MVKAIGEIYRCEICGNQVEVIEVGGGELVCCGQPMRLLEEENGEEIENEEALD